VTAGDHCCGEIRGDAAATAAEVAAAEAAAASASALAISSTCSHGLSPALIEKEGVRRVFQECYKGKAQPIHMSAVSSVLLRYPQLDCCNNIVLCDAVPEPVRQGSRVTLATMCAMVSCTWGCFAASAKVDT
jgi:hypothetical protein